MISSKFLDILILTALILIFTSCGSRQTAVQREPPAPDLAIAVEQYKARQYEEALATLTAVIEHRTTKTGTKVEAHKLKAFIYALQQKADAARGEFLKAFALKRDFSLDKAEAGNPFWTPPFEGARHQAELLYMPPGELTARAIDAYLKREYTPALERFNAALNHKELKTRDKVTCYKFTAFIHALQNRPQEAKTAFRRAFETDARFSLDKGEYGNPVWTPLYDEVQKEMKK